MLTLCPNFDIEDGLDTVLEVPIPEEMVASSKNIKSWQKWMKSHTEKTSPTSPFGDKNTELHLLLGVVGAPLIPLPVPNHHSFDGNFKGHSIEASTAKYIVQQYIAAAGGDEVLNSIDNMYAVGKVKMATTEVISGGGLSMVGCNNLGTSKVMKIKSVRNGPGEMGGFVLWQNRPDLWSLELVVSACKISAGSDGKVAWRQTPGHHSHASRGPPRPIRRSLQGLDPRSTANLFSNSICIGEKIANGEECFVLKLEAESSVLKARSSRKVEMMSHTVWGYFSHKSGLLVQLEDTHILRICSSTNEVFWETTMKSQIEDYRTIDGVNIAHGGRTGVSLYRHGENSEGNTTTKMEEVWTIEEVDFNIMGLSVECFLPPADLKKEEETCGGAVEIQGPRNLRLPVKVARANPVRVNDARNVAKVASVDQDVLHTVRQNYDVRYSE